MIYYIHDLYAFFPTSNKAEKAKQKLKGKKNLITFFWGALCLNSWYSEEKGMLTDDFSKCYRPPFRI